MPLLQWERGSLVIMISWIDDNMILGPEDLVMQVKAILMKQFKCNDCGHFKEYVGNKIKYVGEDAIQFVQTVLLQCYSNEFKLGKTCFNTPAILGTVLKKPAEVGKILNSKDHQTILRSGIGKLMYHMQYLHPDIAQAVRDLARHMTPGDETHMAAMLRCMQYLACTKDAGLLLKPTRKFYGTNKFQFKIRGRLDLDYAKDM
jgi:hypothetical protein